MSENPITIGNFQLENCLATGRYTQVWEASDAGSTRSVALKMLLPEAFANRAQKQGLKYEAKVGQQLEHPNLIKVIDCIVNRDHAYIVMDLFRANNVKIQLRSNLNSIWLRARKLIESTAEALGHMHSRGWIHKDVKPENILLNKAAEVRLIDFSLAAKPAGSLGQMVNRKKRGPVQGTRTYMAPEQIRNQSLTPQTDIYSFGVSIYEFLTGRSTFCSPHPDQLLKDHLSTTPLPPSEYNENITTEMDQIVLKMLAKIPKRRHENIDEFLTEFRNVRIFQEEVQEEKKLSERQKEELLLKEQEEGLSFRVDSRLDAIRTAARKNDPNAAPPPPKPQVKKPVPKVSSEPAPPAPASPPSQVTPQPGMPLQAMTPEQQAVQQAMQQQAMQQAMMQQQAMQQAMQQQALQQQALQQAMQQQALQQQAALQQQPGQPQVSQQAASGQETVQPSAAQQPEPVIPEKKSAKKKKSNETKDQSEGTIMNITDMEMFDSLPDVS